MKLGIAVVYMVKKESARLLDLHLGMLARHTREPYAIYAGVHRLLPEYRDQLALRSDVKVVECPDTDLRRWREHSYYLEHLVRAAVEDGCTHVVTMHPDSFPISGGWEHRLAGHLEGENVLATILQNGRVMRPSACLFFKSDFYREHEPRFALTEEELETSLYKEFRRRVPHRKRETGLGYLLTAFEKNLGWFPLRRTDNGDEIDDFCHGIFDDFIFHLDGVFRSRLPDMADPDERFFRSIGVTAPVGWLRSLPRRTLFRILPGLHHTFFVKPLQARARDLLLSDPQAYLERLTGRRLEIGPAN